MSCIVVFLAGTRPAAAQPSRMYRWNATDSFEFYPPNRLENWKFGIYGGVFIDTYVRKLAVTPFLFRSSQVRGENLVAANVVWKAARLPYLPVNVEVDLMAGRHFGHESFTELATVPTLCWTWFPWNDHLYTTYRFGILGPSWTTKASRDEAMGTNARKTSCFLSYMISEWTFAPDEKSPWEGFVRVHHRSGIYGRINGVSGGANYVAVGVRSSF